MRYIYFLLLLTMMIGQASAKSLAEYHAHDDIANTAMLFVQNNLQHSKNTEIQVKVSPIDSRLKLKKCESPLSAFTTSDVNQNARLSVGIKCSGQKPWSLYVTVKVKRIAALYVASTPLSKGETITEHNIQQVKRDISKLRRGFYNDSKQLIGMIAKRSIRAGTIFSSAHLNPPLIIKKGDSVDIIAKTSAITIRMTGKAMSNGAQGQRIRVKNNSSKKVIEAIAVRAGVVKVRI